MIFATYKAAEAWLDTHKPLLENGTCQIDNDRYEVIPWLGTNVKAQHADPPWNRLCIESSPDETEYEVLVCQFPENSIRSLAAPSLISISRIRYVTT
jgi:hypothetical protein